PRNREDRPGAEERNPHHRGDRRGTGDGDEAARFPFKQEQLDREQRSREGSGKDRGHAARRAGHQQGLALGGREVKRLREQRSEGAAGHDDGAFGSEWAARANRDRRREWLEDRHLGRHPAAPDQDGLECFRDAVTPYALAAIAGHEADDETADNRYGDRPESQVVL